MLLHTSLELVRIEFTSAVHPHVSALEPIMSTMFDVSSPDTVIGNGIKGYGLWFMVYDIKAYAILGNGIKAYMFIGYGIWIWGYGL
ncbi:unnamed protein product [Lactuca virosa]|uniref:Uncharacterized protein n=1 Tax=Lactuca virosa TaxID=75947 RepID=A0AAU9NGL0_9ASTR|nr:unnamed protein product [Lactuca virosa]